MMEIYTENGIQESGITLPVVPLRGKVAFPFVNISFEVGREMTLRAIERAATGDKRVLICTQKQTEKDEVTQDDLYFVGCVARIKQTTRLSGGVLRVVCEGLYRAKTEEIAVQNGYFCAVATPLPSVHGDPSEEEAYYRVAKGLVKDVLGADGKITKETVLKLDHSRDVEEFIHVAVSAMRIRLDVKQSILSADNVVERLKLFERCLNDEYEIAKIEKKIASSVRQNIDKSQKEYFLREQLKAIHSELGDDGKEEDEYREKIQAKGLSKELETKCLKEIDRMEKMQPTSPEYTVISGYLDQVLELPWTEETRDTESVAECAKTLEADHYGLEKIKQRILEYLSVLKLTGNMKAPILCFVGPPGVGKTSIAQSIARALGRKFVRMSLGGTRDEAEIRGHRRTYIGAMPGRIIGGMKNAGSINPVFLLDEIDKLSSDIHGDPASALLEALDPEQNSTFRDRYLDAPYDLSKVLFLTTANSLDTIPAPLRDRLEIIELSGYTQEEKTEIAKRYLVPKQLKANGLSEKKAAFTDAGLQFIIEGYTKEAGVRTLERTIGTACRKLAVRCADNPRCRKVTVDEKKAEALLGAPRYNADELRTRSEVGAVTGLAWTAVGGTTLTVEVALTYGKGEVKLTGKLGDVMKESAMAAYTFVRANADRYGIDPDRFAKTDLHIHVPEGATPKDGPSAGITMATAILSAFTERKVKADIAMTGEITLRGNVLPIGGLKEKSLAARRAKIKTVLVPIGNKRDAAEVPECVKEDVKFILISRADEAFAIALEPSETPAEKPEKISKEKRLPKPLPALPTRENERGNMRCKKNG
ncbi:MAG: endopeptidase La [Clostridia bacterium]|nr:endopeptidase La [Clostridia bacterium]